MLSYRSLKLSSFLKILFPVQLKWFPLTLSSSSLIPLFVWSNLLLVPSGVSFISVIVFFSSVWLFSMSWAEFRPQQEGRSGRHKFDSSTGAKATQEAAPCWSPLCSETDPTCPPHPFQHTHPFPFPTNPAGFLTYAICLERTGSWEEMLASLQDFPSPGRFRALESSMGHGSGGEEVGREQTDHSRSIQQGASFFSRDTCIEHFHRQLQGWDRGWGPRAATGAPNPVLQKLQTATGWGKGEFTGWNSSQGDCSVWLQHFNKSLFLGRKN